MKYTIACFLKTTVFALIWLAFGCQTDDNPERIKLLPPDIKSQQVKDFIPKNYQFDSTDYDAVYVFQDAKGTQNKLSCNGTSRGYNDESKKINRYSYQLRDTLNHVELWYEIHFGVTNTGSGNCDALVTTYMVTSPSVGHQQINGGASVCLSDEKIRPSKDTEYFSERNILNKPFKDIYCKKGAIVHSDDSANIDYEICIEAGKGIVAYAFNGRFYICE
jgi:hypothetical protein